MSAKTECTGFVAVITTDEETRAKLEKRNMINGGEENMRFF
jgi:hypothetical protein